MPAGILKAHVKNPMHNPNFSPTFQPEQPHVQLGNHFWKRLQAATSSQHVRLPSMLSQQDSPRLPLSKTSGVDAISTVEAAPIDISHPLARYTGQYFFGSLLFQIDLSGDHLLCRLVQNGICVKKDIKLFLQGQHIFSMQMIEKNIDICFMESTEGIIDSLVLHQQNLIITAKKYLA